MESILLAEELADGKPTLSLETIHRSHLMCNHWNTPVKGPHIATSEREEQCFEEHWYCMSKYSRKRFKIIELSIQKLGNVSVEVQPVFSLFCAYAL